jgi:hypothetical protein
MQYFDVKVPDSNNTRLSYTKPNFQTQRVRRVGATFQTKAQTRKRNSGPIPAFALPSPCNTLRVPDSSNTRLSYTKPNFQTQRVRRVGATFQTKLKTRERPTWPSDGTVALQPCELETTKTLELCHNLGCWLWIIFWGRKPSFICSRFQRISPDCLCG